VGVPRLPVKRIEGPDDVVLMLCSAITYYRHIEKAKLNLWRSLAEVTGVTM
jgi:hypothetical protein